MLDNCFNRVSDNDLNDQVNNNMDVNDLNKILFNQGYLSNDENVNPTMYDWNKISLLSCDGGFFMGSVNNPQTKPNNDIVVYLRGRNILENFISDIIENTDILLAT
eukprot:UN33181